MLERIQKENDIKKLNSEELECLAGEIREFLVEGQQDRRTSGFQSWRCRAYDGIASDL